MRALSSHAKPTLEEWLTALNEMSQITTLHLAHATPAVSVDSPLISEPQRTVTLPSLTHFNIDASANDCALALAHLPALISLRMTSLSHSQDGNDVRLLVPYVARNAHGPQDAAPLQTILFNGEATGANVEVCNGIALCKAAAPARLVFTVITDSEWRDGTDTVIFEAMLSHLPLNTISTLSAQNNTRLRKEVWLSHVPRMTTLKRALLVPTAVRAFREML